VTKTYTLFLAATYTRERVSLGFYKAESYNDACKLAATQYQDVGTFYKLSDHHWKVDGRRIEIDRTREETQ
jgi:hypothetical protein